MAFETTQPGAQPTHVSEPALRLDRADDSPTQTSSQITAVTLFLLSTIFCYACSCLIRERRKRKMSRSDQENSKESAPESYPWPWTQPPKQLPGPYDPRLLPPIPTPTVRPYSQPQPIQQTSPPPTPSPVSSTNYSTRVVSTIDGKQYNFEGTITRSNDTGGSWRRNQWTTSSG